MTKKDTRSYLDYIGALATIVALWRRKHCSMAESAIETLHAAVLRRTR